RTVDPSQNDTAFPAGWIDRALGRFRQTRAADLVGVASQLLHDRGDVVDPALGRRADPLALDLRHRVEALAHVLLGEPLGDGGDAVLPAGELMPLLRTGWVPVSPRVVAREVGGRHVRVGGEARLRAGDADCEASV